MKKTFIIFMFLFLIGLMDANCKAESTNINIDKTSFPGESLRRYILKDIDINKDGLLSDKECADVKCIVIDNPSIAEDDDFDKKSDYDKLSEEEKNNRYHMIDLSGLQNFPNLDDLTLIANGKFINLNVSDEFYKLFEVVIQLGAILAVVIIYFKTILPWGFEKNKEDTKDTLNLWGKILVACLPAAIIGILFDDWLDEHLYNSTVVALMLIIYGVLFIVIESKKIGKQDTSTIKDITYKQALQVGCFQLLSLIPGTSRSGATIIGGLLVGLKRSVAAEFTFFLAIPVMAGASLLKLLKYILNVGLVFNTNELLILGVGCLVAFIVSIIVIKFLISYIRKHDFKVFGYYRIILGILVLLYFFIK